MPSFIAEESLNSVRVFWLDQEGLIQEIYRVARKVGETERMYSRSSCSAHWPKGPGYREVTQIF